MAIARWDQQVIEGCSKIGRDASPGPKLLGWMRDASFTNLHHTRRVLPIGMWPKDEVMVNRFHCLSTIAFFARCYIRADPPSPFLVNTSVVLSFCA